MQVWADACFEWLKALGRQPQVFDCLGAKFDVPSDVMPIHDLSVLFGMAIEAEVREGERVLDMGSGCGVNAVLAARGGASVVSVDINPLAVNATRDNAFRNGLTDRIEVRISDLFENVEGPFDLIIFNPPFWWFPPRDLFEAALSDGGYRTLTKFFGEVTDYLVSSGRILLLFGASADLGYLHDLIRRADFKADVVARQDLVMDGIAVEHMTYRLVREECTDGGSGRP